MKKYPLHSVALYHGEERKSSQPRVVVQAVVQANFKNTKYLYLWTQILMNIEHTNCENCQARISNDHNFCNNCGNSIDNGKFINFVD